MVVGIIDSGIDTHNKTLMQQVVDGFSLYLGEKGNNFDDTHGHGTLTASTILAIAPNTQFVVARALNDNIEGSSSDIIQSVELLTRMGVDIIHASLSTSNMEYAGAYAKLCTLLHRTRQANRSKGRVGPYLVASRHNDSAIPHSLPAMLTGCIGVDGSMMLQSNEFWYNPTYQYQIVTSRTPVLTTGLGGNQEFYGGTSKAAAIATGVLALALEGACSAEGLACSSRGQSTINGRATISDQALQKLLMAKSTRQTWKIPLDSNFSEAELAQAEQGIRQTMACHQQRCKTQYKTQHMANEA